MKNITKIFPTLLVVIFFTLQLQAVPDYWRSGFTALVLATKIVDFRHQYVLISAYRRR